MFVGEATHVPWFAGKSPKSSMFSYGVSILELSVFTVRSLLVNTVQFDPSWLMNSSGMFRGTLYIYMNILSIIIIIWFSIMKWQRVLNTVELIPPWLNEEGWALAFECGEIDCTQLLRRSNARLYFEEHAMLIYENCIQVKAIQH